jgi:hypothetical protein
MSFNQERLLVLCIVAVVVLAVWLLQLTTWLAMLIGATLVLGMIGWRRRWYRGADRKWYRTW